MRVDPVERWNLTLCAGAVMVSWAWAPPGFAWSLAVGGLLEAVNFRGLRRSGKLLFATGQPGSWSAGFAIRFALLTVGVAASLYAGAHPVGLVLGLSFIVPAVVFDAWRRRPAVIEDLPALSADDPEWDRWNPWLARETEPDEDEA